MEDVCWKGEESGMRERRDEGRECAHKTGREAEMLFTRTT